MAILKYPLIVLLFIIYFSTATTAATTITMTGNTTGVTASPLSYNQTNIAAYGFSIKTSAGTNFSALTLTSTQTINSYFSNIRLVYCTSATYSAGASTNVPITTSTLSATSLTISITTPTSTSTTLAANTAKNYFLLVDYTGTGSIANTFQFSLTTATTSGVSYTTPTLAGKVYSFASLTCDWIGGTSAVWTLAANWQAGRVPGPYDDVQICVDYSPSTNVPVLSTAGTTTIGSLTFGGNFTSSNGTNWPGLSVSTGATLNVTGDINFNQDTNPGTYNINGGTGSTPTNQILLKGAGTIQAVNLSIFANYGTNAAKTCQQVLTSSINSLVLSGDLSLTSEKYKSGTPVYDHYATFYVSAGTTEIDGKINTINKTNTTTYSTSTVEINPSASTGATLELDGAAPLSGLGSLGTNNVDFNDTYAEVNYAGTVAQPIYTNGAITGLPAGVTYYDLTLSGTATQTAAAGTLTVADDFTTTSANAKLNTNNTVLNVSDIAYINDGIFTLGTGAFTVTKGIDVHGNSVFNAGGGTITDGIFLRVNNDYLNATINLSSGTTTIGSYIQLFGGTLNCGAGPVSVAGSTQIYSAAILNAGTVSGSSLTLSGTYQNALGGTFTAGAGSVYFNGTSYSNSGTFTAGAGTVYFNQSAAQTLSDASAAGTTFNTVSFSGTTLSNAKTMSATGTGAFYISETGILKMVGATTKLDAGGVLTLKSNATSTAAVDIIPAGSIIVGMVNVQRYLTGGSSFVNGRWVYRNYRLMSSPVNTVSGGNTSSTGNYPYTLKYLAASSIVTGAKGGYNKNTNTFGSLTAVGNPTIYLFREDKTPSNSTFTSGNFIGVSDISTTPLTGTTDVVQPTCNLSVGNGFMFYFRGDQSSPAAETSSPFIAVNPTIVTSTGYLNQGSYKIKHWTRTDNLLPYENSPTYNGVVQNNTGVRGYNLVGNPYASSIDWETFNSSNTSTTGIVGNTTSGGAALIGSQIWVFNPFTNQYNTYMKGDGGVGKGISPSTTGAPNTTNANIIPSGQGFFVQALSNAGCSLTFNESAKVATAQPASGFLLMGTPAESAVLQYMRLVLVKDSVNNDDMLLFFRSTADTKYDVSEDAKYFPGINAAESLASFSSDSVKLAINRLPLPKTNSQVINLSVKAAASGSYTFRRDELKSIPDIYEIWLMDAYKKDSLDIKNNTTYAFDINLNDTTTFGDHRFQVVIRQNQALNVHLLNFAATKATDGSQLVWKTENEQNYTNFTVERSTDGGKTFDVLGGQLSNAEAAYSYTDTKPLIATNYYRVKIEDLNGTISYTKTIPLMYTKLSSTTASSNVNVFPNPAKGPITVAITPNTLGSTGVVNNSFAVIVTSSNGTVVQKTTTSLTEWQGNVANLLPGSYVIQVVNNTDKSLVGKTKLIKL